MDPHAERTVVCPVALLARQQALRASQAGTVLALDVALSALAVAVFLYGLNLQMPVWPDTEELANIFTPAKKR